MIFNVSVLKDTLDNIASMVNVSQFYTFHTIKTVQTFQYLNKNITDACATMDCYNGGTCSIEKHTGTPKCSCNNGYNGSHCEES